jgi:hypothetical protein
MNKTLTIGLMIISLALAPAATSKGGGGYSRPTNSAVHLSVLDEMPVKEITIFKDGHAFVLHQGDMPTTKGGDVILKHLPTPVLGTFWPSVNEGRARLQSVVASQRRVVVNRTTLNMKELLEANIGASITVHHYNDKPSYDAVILALPSRSSQEMESTSPPGVSKMLPQKGQLVLLKTKEGTRAVTIDQIREIELKGETKTTLGHEEFRNLLTLNLDWKGKAKKKAEVGLIYLQKGVRWIPSYKIDIDGNGKAHVKLQATLINEMVDLNDVTAHLVIGVPTFAFANQIDPIALQQTLAGLSPYFQGGQTQSQFSNSIMSQSLQQGSRYNNNYPTDRPMNLGPEVAGGGENEDHYIFQVDHVTLKKGERMVLPIAEFELEYKDIYTLDLYFAPPPELRGYFNSSHQQEMAQLLHSPKVVHKLRMRNTGKHPLTTAPALVLRNGDVLAQGLMTYTSVGSTIDLPITAAVDILITKSEEEVGRIPNAKKWAGSNYMQVDLKGSTSLKNFKSKPVELEVVRYVLGQVDETTNDGTITKSSVFGEALSGMNFQLYNWYNWPSWWHHFNGINRVTWNFELKPKEKIGLEYKYHYFFR